MPSPSPTPSLAPENQGHLTGADSATSANNGPAEGATSLGRFLPRPTAPRDISSRVDDSNIIPEGVSRTRERSRRYAYAVAVEK